MAHYAVGKPPGIPFTTQASNFISIPTMFSPSDHYIRFYGPFPFAWSKTANMATLRLADPARLVPSIYRFIPARKSLCAIFAIKIPIPRLMEDHAFDVPPDQLAFQIFITGINHVPGPYIQLLYPGLLFCCQKFRMMFFTVTVFGVYFDHPFLTNSILKFFPSRMP
jgi:hypothetical protein